MLIRVDPVILKQNSGSISGIGSNVNNSGQSASSSAQGAPSYDGQFGPRVQAIGHEALARAQGLLNNMNNLSSQLLNKAQAFEAADMAGVAGFTNINNGAQIPATGPWWTGLPVDIINLILKLGGLFGGATFTGLLGTVLLGNGLSSGNGQTFIGLGKPSWEPGGVPRPYGEKQPVKPPEPSSSPSQKPQISLEIKQEDPKWAGDPMGPNGTLGQYGCTVTALTMLLCYYGINITPADFNNWLRDHNGYVDGSYLDWSKAQEYINSMLPNQGKLAQIGGLATVTAELNLGHPVVLHVPGPTEDGHWVLAVPPPGKDGTFNVYDPWTGSLRSISSNQVKGDSRSFN
jgi:hypothetical protein